jgi:cell division protein FtsB
MLRANEKYFIRKIVFRKISLIVLVIVFAIFASGTWNVYKKEEFARENRQMAEKELEDLRQRETALTEELTRLNTKRGLEEEIRQKFDVGRDGEQLIVLVDAPDPEPVVVLSEPTIWQRIVGFFGFK